MPARASPGAAPSRLYPFQDFDIISKATEVPEGKTVMPRQKLKFEGLVSPSDPRAPAVVADGHGELNWLNVLVFDKAMNNIPGGNLEIAPHSGRAVATTQLAAIRSAHDDDFHFRKAFFSAAEENSSIEVHVKAYDTKLRPDGTLKTKVVGEVTFTVDTGDNLLVRFGKTFKSVDQVEIDTLGLGGIFQGPVAMDDLVVVTHADLIFP